MEQKVKFFKHNGEWLKNVPQSEFLKSKGFYCEGCIADDDSDLCHSLRECGGVTNASIFQYPSEEELSKLPKAKKYRVALFISPDNGRGGRARDSLVYVANDQEQATKYESLPNFIRWLTDWIEYEE